MKQASFIIVSLFIFLSFAHTQVSIDFQGGMNYANFTNPGNLVAGAVWTSRDGFVGGISVSIPINDRVMVWPGIRFVQKGTHSEWSSGWTGHVNASVTNGYLEIPVYLKCTIADFGPKFFFIGGLAFSSLINSHTEGTTELFGNSSRDTQSQYKWYDASVDFGLSLRLPATQSTAITATGLYSFGVVRISDQGSNEQTRDIRFLLGISFSLSK
jgi:hypothetical protein